MTGEGYGLGLPSITDFFDGNTDEDATISREEFAQAARKHAAAIREQFGFTNTRRDDDPDPYSEPSSNRPSRDIEPPHVALQQETLETLQDEGLPVDDPWDVAPTYSTRKYEGEPLDPVGVKSVLLTDFLEFCDAEISAKRRDKLRWVDHILEQPENIDFDRAADWYERPDDVDFDRFNADVFTDDPGFELRKPAKPYDPDAYWDELRESTDQIETQILDAATADLIDTMYGLAPVKDDTYRDQVEQFDRALDRYNPDTYTALMENDHEYTVRTFASGNAMQLAACTVRSCLAGKRFDGVFDEYEDDPYTFFQAIARDGTVQGYTRSFLLEDADGDWFLGLDTIEVPLKEDKKIPKEKNKDFESNRDIVKAGALAAVQTGLDLGVKYVAARDTRLRHGARDGYSGVKQPVTYEKPGETVQSYVVSNKDLVRPQTRNIRKAAGSIPFIDKPHDIEVRGFDTLDEHETDAYILMENPAYNR